MKMIKAMKKLKFWSRKKRKKKYSSYDPYFDYHYRPPSTYHHTKHHYLCSSSSSSAQPSAPPLPPWLEQELTQEPVCEPCRVQSVPAEKEVVYTSQTTHHTQFTCQEVVQETSPMLHHPTLPVESSSSSYQQHMDPNPPVYGLPVVQTSSANIERKSSDVFGCFVRSGLNLVGCFFPCLTIREADHDRLKLHAPYKKL